MLRQRITPLRIAGALVLFFSLTALPPTGTGLARSVSAKEMAAEAFLSSATDSDVALFLKIASINSLEDYARWLAANTEYEEDYNRDHWAHPVETLLRKKGDCEDFAFLNAAVLKHFGYEPRIVGYGNGLRAHVFCIFWNDGRYSVLDNNTLHHTPATRVEDFAIFLWEEYGSQYFLEVTQNGRIEILYEQKTQIN